MKLNKIQMGHLLERVNKVSNDNRYPSDFKKPASVFLAEKTIGKWNDSRTAHNKLQNQILSDAVKFVREKIYFSDEVEALKAVKDLEKLFKK